MGEPNADADLHDEPMAHTHADIPHNIPQQTQTNNPTTFGRPVRSIQRPKRYND